MITSAEKVKAIYKVTDTHIFGFFNEHRFLSNFHLHSIEYEGILYSSNESAYHAAKTTLPSERLQFAAYDPTTAKSKGRQIALREDWLTELPEEVITRLAFDGQRIITQVRDKIMYDINLIKFSVPILKDMLQATGDKYLEETNWWRDNYWGVIQNEGGLNKLGWILMKIREEYKRKLKEA